MIINLDEYRNKKIKESGCVDSFQYFKQLEEENKVKELRQRLERLEVAKDNARRYKK